MKNLALKIVALLLLVFLFSSCEKYKKEIEQLKFSQDSIQLVVGERDNVILDYVGSMNEIQFNLDSIKEVQKLVNMSFAAGDENKVSEKDRIVKDILLINEMLNKNKDMVAALQRKLKASNIKSSELEIMLQNYVIKIQEKDSEIALLNDQLKKMKVDISNLNVKIEELASESTQKTMLIESQKDEMNTVYYCFGTKEELLANNVIEKTGGFIGIGKTIKVKTDINNAYFNKEDQRKFSEVVLMAKSAKLLTIHLDGSYQFNTTEDEVVKSITIDNAAEFWKVSKYMIILVEQE